MLTRADITAKLAASDDEDLANTLLELGARMGIQEGFSKDDLLEAFNDILEEQ